MEEETKKAGRPPAKVKCEVVRKLFIDGPKGYAVPVSPGELSHAELAENAKRRKQGKTEIKPEKVFIELDRDIAVKMQEVGAVKVVL
jgi:hypothetical protein